jgi:hypothetical protein
MGCQKCNSNRIANVYAKCDDRFNVELYGNQITGYVSSDFEIGSGDEMEFSLCLDCGQVQGQFPVPPTCLETDTIVDEEDGFCGL